MLALLLVAWFALNYLTITRYPVVWIDEVSYADPAINLVESGHWVSSCWAQPVTQFWAGNTPLYPMLLYVWLKVTGVSMMAVRSFNLLIMILLALALWRALRRLRPAGRPGAGLLLMLLLLSGYSMILDYRGGRPDCLCALLFGLAFMAVATSPTSSATSSATLSKPPSVTSSEPSSEPSSATSSETPSQPWSPFSLTVRPILGKRELAVFLCAALMPWAGLQCLPVLAVTGGLVLLFDRRVYGGTILAAALGAIVGLAGLWLFYKAHGAWPTFVASVAPHTSAGMGQFRHHNRLPKDFSLILLFAGALLVQGVCRKRSSKGFTDSPLTLGLVLSLAIGAGLILAGKFPTYYGWAAYVPLALAVVLEWADSASDSWKRRLLTVVCGATVLVGPVLHGAAALYDWPFRAPSIPETLVARNVRSGDMAYADQEVYYALRRHGLVPYVGYYIETMSPEEKQRVSILFLKPERLEWARGFIGGTWEKVDEYKPPRMGFLGTRWDMGFLSAMNYHLAVYRRAEGGRENRR